jgi:hypothetical protein
MKRTLFVAALGLALAGLTSLAWAYGSQSGTGGSSSSGNMGTTATHNLTGKVLKADASTITILSHSAAIPLKVDKNTSFSGVKSSTDLKAGEEVRASYQVNNDTNQATAVTLVNPGTSSKGTGGTGSKSSGSSGGSTFGGTGQ